MWLFHNLQEKIEQRKLKKICERCEILYFKAAAECPHCSEIEDYKLILLLKKRARFRMGLGKAMLLSSVVILLFLLFINNN